MSVARLAAFDGGNARKRNQGVITPYARVSCSTDDGSSFITFDGRSTLSPTVRKTAHGLHADEQMTDCSCRRPTSAFAPRVLRTPCRTPNPFPARH